MSTFQKTAVFDIDGTIFRSSLLIELTEGLIEQGLFPPAIRQTYRTEHRAWQNRQASYEEYISAVIRAFLSHLKGLSYAEFLTVSDSIVEREKDKLYRFTRDLLPILKDQGYFLLAVSQSPKGTLDRFCRHLGFDKVYGRVYQLGPTGRFTGEVEDLHLIANKANIVRRAVNKENLTLTDSVGVGDTEDDIPFLEQVDYPICFNPNRGLYRQAKLNQWAVVIERKDLIYPILVPNYLFNLHLFPDRDKI